SIKSPVKNEYQSVIQEIDVLDGLIGFVQHHARLKRYRFEHVQPVARCLWKSCEDLVRILRGSVYVSCGLHIPPEHAQDDAIKFPKVWSRPHIISRMLEPFRYRKLAAILVLGFSSGLPLDLTNRTLQAWLTVEGVNLTAIGFFGLISLPYSLKFLWSPVIARSY